MAFRDWKYRRYTHSKAKTPSHIFLLSWESHRRELLKRLCTKGHYMTVFLYDQRTSWTKAISVQSYVLNRPSRPQELPHICLIIFFLFCRIMFQQLIPARAFLWYQQVSSVALGSFPLSTRLFVLILFCHLSEAIVNVGAIPFRSNTCNGPAGANHNKVSWARSPRDSHDLEWKRADLTNPTDTILLRLSCLMHLHFPLVN